MIIIIIIVIEIARPDAGPQEELPDEIASALRFLSYIIIYIYIYTQRICIYIYIYI